MLRALITEQAKIGFLVNETSYLREKYRSFVKNVVGQLATKQKLTVFVLWEMRLMQRAKRKEEKIRSASL